MFPRGKPWNERIREFAPSWYSVCMGVGVQTSLLHAFPYDGGHRNILDGFATAFLILDIFLFICITGMTVARYIMYPESWTQLLYDPVQSLFMGCCPIALSTIINGLVVEAYLKIAGAGFLYFIWALWWIDVSLAILSNFGLFWVMVTRHYQGPNSPTATWLLPIVPTVVAGHSGALVAEAFLFVNPHYALLTTLLSVVLMLMGLAMSSAMLVLHIQQLIVYGFPTSRLAVSVFLPLSPLGQGGYGFLVVSDLLPRLLPQSTSADNYLARQGVAQILAVVAFGISVLLWVSGFWFLVPAVVSLSHPGHLPFAVPWWGLVFPTGVYSLLTVALGNKLNSGPLRILGTIFTLAIFVVFTGIATRTLIMLYDESVGYPPCHEDELLLRGVTKERRENEGDPARGVPMGGLGDVLRIGLNAV